MHSFVLGTQEAARFVSNYLLLSLGKIQSFHKSVWSLPALPTKKKKSSINKWKSLDVNDKCPVNSGNWF